MGAQAIDTLRPWLGAQDNDVIDVSDWLIDWLIDWLTDWLIDCQLASQLAS